MAAAPGDAAKHTISDVFARFERARRTNAKCAAKDFALRNEFRQIDRRRIELATMRKMNAGQRNVWLQDIDEKTIIPYSKAWNRAFAERIQATFPCEIRSMIYDCLLDDNMYNEYEYALQAVMSAVPPEVGHCRCLTHGHGRPRVPHYLFVEYVGSETAKEIVEMLYRSDWFKEQMLYDIPLNLHKLIHEDAFGAGFDPAPCITGLDIVCLVDKHRHPPISHKGDKSCQHDASDRRYIQQNDLKSSFSHLLAVANNKVINYLEITFMQRNVRVDVLEEALETFSDVYSAFEKAGVEVNVQWVYAVPDCSRRHKHSREVDDFFEMSRSAWKDDMHDFLRMIRPCMKPRHVHFIREPNMSLPDSDFVHRMWDEDEEFVASDEEDSQDEDEGSEDDGSESGLESD